MLKTLFYLSALSLPLFCKTYTAQMAQNHIGEKATVCGKVVSTHYASSTKGEPTFLNLDEPYPNQIFTAIIWGDSRANFDNPERRYKGKHVCVTGKIKSYQSTAEIILYSKSQISVK